MHVSGEGGHPTTVIAFAFSCEPGRGSEPGVGYSFARGLAQLSAQRRCRVLLLTRPHTAQRTREALEQEVSGGNVEVVPVTIPLWLVRMTKVPRVRIAYVVWQLKAVICARSVVKRTAGPVVVHHLTFASDVMPTFEALLPRRVPRIFGPAGSSQLINQRLWTKRKAVAHSVTRALLARPNMRGVDTLICQNSAVADEWKGKVRRVVVEPNVILPPRALTPENGSKRETTKLLCVGGLIERKQPQIAIEMLSFLPKEYRLHLVGSGPLEGDLRQLAESRGVADRVIFEGPCSHEEVLEMMATASVLVHPSRQEGAGWVVGEAQALGASPVVLEGSGSDTLVRLAGIGRIVQLTGRQEIAERVADAVLAASKERPVPTTRWSDARIPGLLADWYRSALEHVGDWR